MPGLVMDLVADIQIEILAPKKVSLCQSIRCDCCREQRGPEEFEPDSCGICISCLECDDMLVDLDACASSAHPVV